LENFICFFFFQAGYNHLDFVWGENAHIEIYAKVVELAQQYASKNRK
jgi:hypothetical protein